LVSNRIDINSGIKKVKVPFIVTSFCLFALEAIVNTLRCLPLGLTNTMLYVDGAIYTIVGLSIGTFYVITAARVVRRVQNSERMKDRFTARVRSSLPSLTNSKTMNTILFYANLFVALFMKFSN